MQILSGELYKVLKKLCGFNDTGIIPINQNEIVMCVDDYINKNVYMKFLYKNYLIWIYVNSYTLKIINKC